MSIDTATIPLRKYLKLGTKIHIRINLSLTWIPSWLLGCQIRRTGQRKWWAISWRIHCNRIAERSNVHATALRRDKSWGNARTFASIRRSRCDGVSSSSRTFPNHRNSSTSAASGTCRKASRDKSRRSCSVSPNPRPWIYACSILSCKRRVQRAFDSWICFSPSKFPPTRFWCRQALARVSLQSFDLPSMACQRRVCQSKLRLGRRLARRRW